MRHGANWTYGLAGRLSSGGAADGVRITDNISPDTGKRSDFTEMSVGLIVYGHEQSRLNPDDFEKSLVVIQAPDFVYK